MNLQCLKCGEPWERFYVVTDLPRWQGKAFLKGAGCPCCQGEWRSLTDEEELKILRLRIFAQDRLGLSSYELKLNLDDPVPAWEPPEPVVVWTCEGCGIQAVEDPSTDLPNGDLNSPFRGMLDWQAGPGFSGRTPPRDDPTRNPPHKIADKPYCPDCAMSCHDCGTAIFDSAELETGDPHDPGAGFLPQGYYDRAVCYSCFCEYEEEE